MKRNRFLELGVGLFMLAGILGLVFLGLRVSGLGVGVPNDTFTVTANFANIGGLRQNAKVTMSGVRVGKVTSIQLDPKWFDAKVTMEIDADYDGKLSDDTAAAILTSGLLGEQYIGLTPGGSPDMLHDGSVIHDTQQALVLEELIQQFVSNMAK
ncbi:outer membrane lipid asymmetry maintenance protein MlaD [Salinicola rhizosphaerae]|uniref:Outer membrane lipid asymmetry maintenance protein MlaD n=1 Tax=Salinicola rhizosphaerae TaxID=1443141 RepID=A0ABQ3EBH8_9GAMM|nr:outer membrane lipid asymmetry maintenance protein MlaD [Salinicola rhizosphaerae]GHB31160.1 outer membrane lipid asymmetry maintenance protein MlaD [Salinicola rhizosphaerae]